MIPLVFLCLTLVGVEPGNPKSPLPKVVVLIQSKGFEHDVAKRTAGAPSRVERTFREMAQRSGGFDVEVIDDASLLTPQRLRDTKIVAFYTTGALPFTEHGFSDF